MGISAWTVKFAVLEGLKTLMPGSADIVKLGLPVQVVPINDEKRIYVLPVPPYQSTPIFEGGTQVRQSTLVVPLIVEAETLTGNDVDGQETAEQNLATLVADIEALIAADPAWGSPAIYSSGLSLVLENAGAIADVQGGGGFLAHAILQVHVRTIGD